MSREIPDTDIPDTQNHSTDIPDTENHSAAEHSSVNHDSANSRTDGGDVDQTRHDTENENQSDDGAESHDGLAGDSTESAHGPTGGVATAEPDEDRGSEAAPTSDADTAPRKPSRREALEAEGDVAADFLEALLDIADIVGDLDVDIDGDRAAVSIVDSDEGRVPRRLVGPDGKVLEALQELTRLAVQTETGERSRLMLDIAGHRAGRRAEIIEVARGVIAQVQETGEQVAMEPMSAFERKIVHDEVLASGLRSESEGVEPHRYVIVLPSS